jgi:hypothetical protein
LDAEDGTSTIDEGIPTTVLHLPCPDDELRAMMLQEFLIIDHKYRDHLQDLNCQYLPIVE